MICISDAGLHCGYIPDGAPHEPQAQRKRSEAADPTFQFGLFSGEVDALPLENIVQACRPGRPAVSATRLT